MAILVSIVFHLALHYDLVFPAYRAFALLSGSGRSYLPFVPAREANGDFVRRNHEEKWRNEEKKRGCQRRSQEKRREVEEKTGEFSSLLQEKRRILQEK